MKKLVSFLTVLSVLNFSMTSVTAFSVDTHQYPSVENGAVAIEIDQIELTEEQLNSLDYKIPLFVKLTKNPALSSIEFGIKANSELNLDIITSSSEAIHYIKGEYASVLSQNTMSDVIFPISMTTKSNNDRTLCWNVWSDSEEYTGTGNLLLAVIEIPHDSQGITGGEIRDGYRYYDVAYAETGVSGSDVYSNYHVSPVRDYDESVKYTDGWVRIKETPETTTSTSTTTTTTTTSTSTTTTTTSTTLPTTTSTSTTTTTTSTTLPTTTSTSTTTTTTSTTLPTTTSTSTTTTTTSTTLPTTTSTSTTTTTTPETTTTTTTDSRIPSTFTHTFTWGKDNWNFNNSKENFPQNQLDSETINKLKENLSNTEYQKLFSENALLSHDWNNACYGMAYTAMLSKSGKLSYSDYQENAYSLHDLNTPVNHEKINALITYYQLLQVKDVIQQELRTIPNRSQEENLKTILNELNFQDTAVIGFQKEGWGSHAVLAYDFGYGDWNWNGEHYDGCIYVYDPNHSDWNDEQCYIYFDSESYKWIIPNSGISSENGAVFNYIHQIDFSANPENYIARLDMKEISENHSVTKVEKYHNSYLTKNTASGSILKGESYPLNGQKNGIQGYYLKDNQSSYKIIQQDTQEMNLTMQYDSCTLSGSSKAGSDIIFDKNGYVSVSGDNADFSISMTFNENYPTDWFSVSVSGENADYAELQRLENGYLLKANKLNAVTVSANNRLRNTNVSFSTEYDEVLLYEIDENTVAVAVDSDNNGSYETLIAQSASQKGAVGDVNEDDNVDAKDAALILVAASRTGAKLDSGLSEKAEKSADVNQDGSFNAKDASWVLCYSADKGSKSFFGTIEEYIELKK